MISREYTHENVSYLRSGGGLTISQLADLVEIDPIDLYQYEREDFLVSKENIGDLAKIANYFTVYLDDLVYADLSLDTNFKKNIFDLLKMEDAPTTLQHRKNFNNKLLSVNESPDVSDGETDENRIAISKHFLRLIHTTYRMEDRYFYRRSKGEIDKNDFFESH